jgi:YHS domain-containing protein
MNLKKALLLNLAGLLFFGVAALAKSEIYTGFLSSSAVGGYDPVAYFTVGQAVKGSDQFMFHYEGANWYFSSAENLARFKNDPIKYAPRYGGYCAWAVAEGDTAKGDPLQWTIHKNRLYLNYNEEIKNRWLADVDNFIAKGDRNWPGVIQ